MHSAIEYTDNTINKLHATGVKGQSIQRALFTLWMDLENSLETVTQGLPAPPIHTSDSERDLDEIIDAQDQVAKTACQSRATTYEELLYKLAMWRLDTPDFESTPIQADRKDRIVYSVFRDLIKITGLDHVQTNTDSETNFLGLEVS